MQKAVGANLLKSVTSFAQTTGYGVYNMDEMMELKKEFKEQGKRVSWTAMFCKAVALTLKEYPMFNARLEGDEVVTYDHINIGVGVDTPKGLLVAVVKDTQDKSLFEIADDLNDLVDRARNNKLTMEDLTGSTVTISNLIGTGSIAFSSVVNNNEAIIFGIGDINREPVVDENDQIVIRNVCRVNMNGNHTLVNGMDSVRMGKRFKEIVQSPREYLL